jgi:hypothetical protein
MTQPNIVLQTPEAIFERAVHGLDTDPYACDGTDRGAIAAGKASALILQGLALAGAPLQPDEVALWSHRELAKDLDTEPYDTAQAARLAFFTPDVFKHQGATLEVNLVQLTNAQSDQSGSLTAEIEVYKGQLPQPEVANFNYSVDDGDRLTCRRLVFGSVIASSGTKAGEHSSKLSSRHYGSYEVEVKSTGEITSVFGHIVDGVRQFDVLSVGRTRSLAYWLSKAAMIDTISTDRTYGPFMF